MCACAGGLVSTFQVQVGFSLGVYLTYQHFHIFFETSQCLQRRHLPSPASRVLGETPAAWIWVISLGGMESADFQAVHFEFCLWFSCLCGSVSSGKTLNHLLDLGTQLLWISLSEAPPLSGLSFRLAFGGPWWLQGSTPQEFWGAVTTPSTTSHLTKICFNVWCVVFFPFLFVFVV